jgi:hypothetical protein
MSVANGSDAGGWVDQCWMGAPVANGGSTMGGCVGGLSWGWGATGRVQKSLSLVEFSEEGGFKNKTPSLSQNALVVSKIVLAITQIIL